MSKKEKKWGLVLSGGGRNGAFAAGVIHALTKELGLNFSVISGTSTGALQAPLVACDQIGLLSDIYCNVETKDIISKRNVFWAWVKGALHNTRPLEKLIDKHLDVDKLADLYPQKKVYVNAVNLRTGKLVRWPSSPVGKTLFKKFVLASASIPVVMDAVKIGRDWYVDGGLVDISPVSVFRDHHDLEGVIAISNEPMWMNEEKKSSNNIFDVMKRSIDIASKEILKNDIHDFEDHINTKKHIHIYPLEHLGESMEFDPKVMRKLWQMGFNEGLRVMSRFDTT